MERRSDPHRNDRHLDVERAIAAMEIAMDYLSASHNDRAAEAIHQALLLIGPLENDSGIWVAAGHID